MLSRTKLLINHLGIVSNSSMVRLMSIASENKEALVSRLLKAKDSSRKSFDEYDYRFYKICLVV